MPGETCPSCGAFHGSNPECQVCCQAATRALAREATAVTPRNVEAAVRRVGDYLERRPWWARGASPDLLARLRLLWLVVRDSTRGQYWLPWHGIAAFAAAALYVVMPTDLVSDFLGPFGFADDLLVVSVTFDLKRRQLLEYCEHMGLSVSRFGLGADH